MVSIQPTKANLASGIWKALPGVPDQAQDHDFLQPLIHMARCNSEDVYGVWIIFRTELDAFLCDTVLAASPKPTAHAFEQATYKHRLRHEDFALVQAIAIALLETKGGDLIRALFWI